MTGKEYIILPREIENGSSILEKVNKLSCFISMLKGKNRLIPMVKFKQFNFSSRQENKKYIFLPDELVPEDRELIYLYHQDEVENYQAEVSFLVSNLKLDEKQQFYLQFFKQILNRDFSQENTYKLYLPGFRAEDLYQYQDIAENLGKNPDWIIELVKFYQFLTDELIQIDNEGLKPDDFLYDGQGHLKFFTGYNQLILKTDKESVLKANLESLAYLLYHYYMEDTEKQEAKLYQQTFFSKLETHLIEPLVYQITSDGLYENFQQILVDLAGNYNYQTPRKRRQKVGVFLDVANIMTPLFLPGGRMVVNYDQLFTKLYGNLAEQQITEKIAVMFKPTYPDMTDDSQPEHFKLIKDYLEYYGFKVIVVENGKPRAKTIINGQEIDVDDQRLLKLIQKYNKKLDSILLLSGDQHFYNLIYELKQQGQDIKIISASPESTYQKFTDFEHYYLTDFWNCLEYLQVG